MRAHDPVTSARRRPSPGFTLVELLVVLAIFTFMLSCVSIAIASLLRVQRDIADEMAHADSAARFALQLRRDAHLAAGVEDSDDEMSILLAAPVGRIVYTSHGNRVVRQVYEADQRRHREVYSFTEGAIVTWSISGEQPETVASIIAVTDLNLPEAAPTATHRIEATVGLHLEKKP